jgi:hypothetical protein
MRLPCPQFEEEEWLQVQLPAADVEQLRAVPFGDRPLHCCNQLYRWGVPSTTMGVASRCLISGLLCGGWGGRGG